MIRNIIIHIVLGYFGKTVFDFSINGIIWVLVISLVIQGLDMISYYRKQIKLVSRTIDETARQEKIGYIKTKAHRLKIFQLYVIKVLFYGALTLFTAYIFR